MNTEPKKEPTEAQNQLLRLINPVDAADIGISLKNVFIKALFCPGDLSEKQKDDLYMLHAIIEIVEKVK